MTIRSVTSAGRDLSAAVTVSRTRLLSICLLSLLMLPLCLAQNVGELQLLTRVDQIRHLTVEEAAKGYPVRIRGVVTGDVPSPDFFVQDATAGVYVEGNTVESFPHLLGDLVEVEGVTGPGKFAPVLKETITRVVGKGTLPKARLYSFAELAAGQQDSQWAQVRGIVREASIDRSSWRETVLAMNVATADGQFKVRVPITHDPDVSSWINSEVLIEGVCGSLFNGDRQLIGILFYVPRLSFIRIEKPADEIPFSALLRFSPDDPTKHRVQVRGVVAYQQLGSALFLQSQGKGLRVLTQQDSRLEPGDIVDVQGFPAVGESAPVLEDGIFHRIGHQASPTPVKFNPDTPWERYDGALITLEARLLERRARPDGLNLVMQHDGIVFDATLPPGAATDQILAIPLNSDLRLTGISLVRANGLWRVPESFRLLLRMPEDVVVVRAPSWWSLRHTLWVLGITVFIALVMIVWNLLLKRRVREQMDVIRQKLHRGTVLEERNRIARELHDTLEQELAGITMQLDLAVDCFQHVPDVSQRALEMARKMSRHSMVAARRSVWDLRCHWLEHGDLASAMTQAITPMLADQVSAKIDVQGHPVRLAPEAEMNLLRIGQEAVANAVKHARAQHISVCLEYLPDKVRLRVVDDGRGFSMDEASLAGNGHFGLVDMHERAKSLGSTLEMQSSPGKGTQIEVEVSIKPEQVHEEPKIHTNSGR